MPVAAAFLLTSGLFLSACESAEPREGDEEADASTSGKGTKASEAKGANGDKDASTGNSDKPTMTGSQNSAQSGDDKCSEDSCKAPATCKDDRCTCPDGYKDVEGDGSKCEDIDECKERTAECPRGSVCKDNDGGYTCECDGPAYKKDGDSCECADGYERNDDGFCSGDDGKKCADGIDCKNGNCEGGICCATSCGEPGTCQVADGAKCSDDGKSCVYPRAEDGASCDDGQACFKDGTCKEGSCEKSTDPTNCNDNNPCTDDSCLEPTGCRNANNTGSCDDGSACTSEDKCVGGNCSGTQKDCSSAADACNAGGCDGKTGECIKEPRKTSALCDDADSCTTGDTCKDDGSCAGTGSACGANATACAAGEGGEPNMCTCSEGFVSYQGRCVPMNDECQRDNPCSENALCTDPSNTDGDLKCECRPGFTGNGVECVQTDPCATNPCGTGNTCTNDNAGGYTCTCAAGTRPVGGSCGCDLSGTFGLRTTQTISWADVDQFLEDGSIQVSTFLLHRHTYDAEGNLKLEMIECGGTSFDMCSVPFEPFLGAEAYGQWVPDSVWGIDSQPRTNVTMNLQAAQPGAAFNTGRFALVNGIKLDDPLGEWPSDRRQVAGSPDSEGTPVNGATWLDSDNDGALGLTTYAVGPAGEMTDGVFPDPPKEYGTRSEECPRLKDGERSEYAYPPAIPNGSLAVQRIKHVYGAQRAILAYEGTIDSCDLVSGSVTGPSSNGQFTMDGRIAGCLRVNGSSDSVCAAGAVDFLDQQPQVQQVSDAKFKLKRFPEGATCRDIITGNYD